MLWVQWVQEQKTEAPVELTIYMFTRFLLDYIQYYLQYLHMVVVLLMLLLYPDSDISSVWLMFVCTPTQVLNFCTLTNLWLGGLFYPMPSGCSWVQYAVPQTVYILTWCLTLYFNMYISSISTPPSTREMDQKRTSWPQKLTLAEKVTRWALLPFTSIYSSLYTVCLVWFIQRIW